MEKKIQSIVCGIAVVAALWMIPIRGIAAVTKPVSCTTDSTLASHLDYLPAFPYVRLMSSKQSDAISDSLFYQVTRPVVFVVNRWEISPTDTFIAELRDYVVPIIRERGWRLDHIELRGAASPEGPWLNNVMLAHNRATALQQAIMEMLPDDVKPLAEQAPKLHEIEDYAYLARMMQDAGDEYADTVTTLCTTLRGRDVELKRRLMSLYGGKVWKHILKTYFPTLRAARVVLWMTPANMHMMPDVAPEPMPLLLEPFKLNIHWPTYHELRWDSTIYRREVLNIKTNLLLDLAYVHNYGFAPMPNGQIEYYPLHGHITPVISFDCPWWSYESAQHKYWQIRNYQAEARYYFRKEDARYDGWYAGVYAHGMLYGVGFNGQKGYLGEGWGLGLTGGYVLPFSKDRNTYAYHWKMEFGLQIGYFRTKYDPYVYGCWLEDPRDYYYDYDYTQIHADDYKYRQHAWNWFGPTRLGISITYDLMYRKAQKKGWSFLWREKALQPTTQEVVLDDSSKEGGDKAEEGGNQ